MTRAPSRPSDTVPPTLAVQRALDGFEEVPSYDREFELDGEIGRGGMGTVVRGIDRRLGRAVAIKVAADEVSGDRGLLRRFVVEAQLGAQLEHPNIVPVYALVATASREPAFVMRLVEGETMAAYLEACAASVEASRTPPRDLASRLERFLKVCDAMEYAHSRTVIHRDLKPENVMLGVHNEVYVMDWGVARVSSFEETAKVAARPIEPDDAPVTQRGDVFGSPGYMAPEQARSETITPASDVYALGMMLAEITTLKPPRTGSTLQQLSEAMLAKPLALAHTFGEALPRELVAVIATATAKEPSRRYAKVADLGADVRRFLRGEAVSVAPDPAWMKVWRWAKHRPIVVLGAILGLALVGSVTLVVSLVREVAAQERAAAQSERVSALTAAVGQTGRALDARFQRMTLLVESLAERSEGIMRAPPREGGIAAPAPSDLAAPTSPARPVDRYRQRVTFEHAVHVRSPGVTAAAVAPVLARSEAIEQALVATASRAAADDDIVARPIAAQREAARERSPILWSDVGFAAGELFVYPGNTYFPADFDVRVRPWYTTAVSRHGHVWGAPYPDATSGRLLVPCSRAFYDTNGALEGVAAIHVRLDDVLDALVVPVKGFEWSALVDPEGAIVLSTKDRGIELDAGTPAAAPGRGSFREPFPVESVRRAIVARGREGRTADGASLVVYQALDTNGWSLAVVVDATEYQFR